MLFDIPQVRILCQFDLTTYSPAFIHAAVRTHAEVLYKGRRRENPFYEAARILEHEPQLNGCSSDAGLISDMLARLSQTQPA